MYKTYWMKSRKKLSVTERRALVDSRKPIIARAELKISSSALYRVASLIHCKNGTTVNISAIEIIVLTVVIERRYLHTARL